MKARKAIVSILIATCLGGAAYSTVAIADVEIFFNVAPPTLRHEIVPSPRQGYVWAPGYWEGKRGKHAWKKGHWEKNREHHIYVQPRWIERNNGWALERGRWNPKDRDGDGVRNNHDRHPDNPNRR